MSPATPATASCRTDIDWQSLADPATTTAIYMPTKTLAALVAKAIAQGLDPQTPALAIARATRPDQAVIAATVIDLPARLAEANLSGPLLVMLGRALAAQSSAHPALPMRGRRRRRRSAIHRNRSSTNEGERHDA